MTREESQVFEFLSKERTIAKPGFNRWLVPPAALAIHLCIGMAYGFLRILAAAFQGARHYRNDPCPPEMAWIEKLFATTCDWRISTLGWMYTLFFVFLGSSAACGAAGSNMSGHAKPAWSALCWCGGMLSFGHRRLHAPILDDAGSAPGHWRHRLGVRLYLSGLHLDQMVSRPARHGDRHGDHGLRRRRDDRLPLADRLMNFYATPDQRGRVGKPFCTDGRNLFRVHDGRGTGVPRSAARLEAGGLDPAAVAIEKRYDHHRPRPSGGTHTRRRNSGCSGECSV